MKLIYLKEPITIIAILYVLTATLVCTMLNAAVQSFKKITKLQTYSFDVFESKKWWTNSIKRTNNLQLHLSMWIIIPEGNHWKIKQNNSSSEDDEQSCIVAFLEQIPSYNSVERRKEIMRTTKKLTYRCEAISKTEKLHCQASDIFRQIKISTIKQAYKSIRLNQLPYISKQSQHWTMSAKMFSFMFYMNAWYINDLKINFISACENNPVAIFEFFSLIVIVRIHVWSI